VRKEIKQVQDEIEALEAEVWTPELGAKHDALLARRAALGWVNPHAAFIQGLIGGKKNG
jgi:hypothetical protein